MQNTALKSGPPQPPPPLFLRPCMEEAGAFFYCLPYNIFSFPLPPLPPPSSSKRTPAAFHKLRYDPSLLFYPSQLHLV